MNFFLSVYTLLQREIVRFLRQKNRIVGALGTPIVFWFLIGSGLGRSFHMPTLDGSSIDLNYLQFFFPGTVAMILLFTAIFSTISIIEDRKEGFLQGVLVSPTSRSAVVLGKLLGGTLLAFFQGMLFLLLTPFLGISFSWGDFLFICLIMLLMSFGLTGLGFLLSWRLDSTQGFHAIMNLFLMPMWFLSGALFPVESAPFWLKWVMKINPLSYSVDALQQVFFQKTILGHSFLASRGTSMVVNIVFSFGIFFLCLWTARSHAKNT